MQRDTIDLENLISEARWRADILQEWLSEVYQDRGWGRGFLWGPWMHNTTHIARVVDIGEAVELVYLYPKDGSGVSRLAFKRGDAERFLTTGHFVIRGKP